VSDLTSRPFVLNRDVESGTDERKVLVNSTEYDGMVENPYVLALNRISAFNAIREWDRDEDYFIDNEYSMSFLIEYQKKMGGKMIPTTARWELEEGRGTLTDYQHLESALRSVISDLDTPGTVVNYLSVKGKTARKTWTRIDTESIDFTPV
jgi:hypothetical protein